MGLKRTDEFCQDAVRIALTSGLTRKQVADDPTLAVARHKCRAGRRLLYRTRATLWIKQEGNP